MQANNMVYADQAEESDRLDVVFSKEVNNIYNLQGELLSSEEVDFVTIKSPGDKTNIIHTIATDAHKARFASRWEAYLNGQAIGGTPLAEWDVLSDSLRMQFIANGFRFVEQIANASHDSFNKIMGGHTWKAKAIAFLNRNQIQESEIIKQQSAELAELKAQIAQLQELAGLVKKPAKTA